MKKTLAIFLAAVLLGGVVGYAAARHPFVDVPVGAYYADAVQWAWEHGITNGTDTTHFSPDKPVTRAELVTMRSCFQKGYDLFIATCNDSNGKDMTATFWTLLEEEP